MPRANASERKRRQPDVPSEEEASKRRKSGDFRLHARKQFYTFPQCPLEPEYARSYFDNKWPITTYIVGQEEHKEEGKHLHCYFQYATKVDVRDVQHLWMTGPDGTVYKGNYQMCRRPASVAMYCCKDGNYITNMSDGQMAKIRSQAKNIDLDWGVVADTARKGDVDTALGMAIEIAPRDVLMKGPGVLRGNMMQLSEKKSERRDFEFKPVPALEAWQREHFSLFLVGESGLGKTQLALSLFENPLKCNHTEKLKLFRPASTTGSSSTT